MDNIDNIDNKPKKRGRKPKLNKVPGEIKEKKRRGRKPRNNITVNDNPDFEGKKCDYIIKVNKINVEDNILDDFELGRSITRDGFNLKVFDGTDRISTFSYSSEKEAIDGLSKSIFPFFQNRIVPFFLLWILFMAMGVVPVLLVFGDLFQVRLSRSKEIMAFLIWGSLTLSWVISSYRSKQGLLPGIFFPIITTITAIIGIFSVLTFLFNKVIWKDRNVSNQDDEISNYEEAE